MRGLSHDVRVLLALVELTLLLAFGIAHCAPYAEAQSVEYQSDLTTLARCLVAEAGPVLRPDHAAILHVLDRRARAAGRSAAAVARRYCTVHRRPQGQHGARVAVMHSIELAEYAPEVFALAARYLRGEPLPIACTRTPDHWGAAYGSDLLRALRAGWARVRCPGASNAFWRVPAP